MFSNYSDQQSFYDLVGVSSMAQPADQGRDVTIEAPATSYVQSGDNIQILKSTFDHNYEEIDEIRLPAGIVNWDLAPGIEREACTTSPRPGNKFQGSIRELIDKVESWRWKIDATPGWKSKGWGNMKHFYQEQCGPCFLGRIWTCQER